MSLTTSLITTIQGKIMIDDQDDNIIWIMKMIKESMKVRQQRLWSLDNYHDIYIFYIAS